jgi:hypothetical protein
VTARYYVVLLPMPPFQPDYATTVRAGRASVHLIGAAQVLSCGRTTPAAVAGWTYK